jgi:hypothetical protein
LDRWRGAAAGAGRNAAIENRFRRFASLDRPGRRVRLPFVSIAGTPDAARKLGSVALLHDVRRFVRSQIYVRFAAKRHAIPGRIGERAHASTGLARVAAHRRPGAAHVVPSERSLNSIDMR